MRLTLRTLLAFIDNQLPEDEAVELGGRIEKSDHAQRLQRRICMLATRRNVPAPQLDVRGVGELNEVSNYLDSTMPAGKVADFEKACLESDIHLSEVAACHNILTMLGKGDEIDPELRRRLYLLNKFPVDSTIGDEEANVEKHGAIAERFIDSGEEKIVPGRGVFELSPPADFSKTAGDSPSDDVTGMQKQLDGPKVRWRVLPVLATVASLLLLTFLILYATQSAPQNEARVDQAKQNTGDVNAGAHKEQSDAALVETKDGETDKVDTTPNDSKDKSADANSSPEEKVAANEDTGSDLIAAKATDTTDAAPTEPNELTAVEPTPIEPVAIPIVRVEPEDVKEDLVDDAIEAESIARLAFFNIEPKELGREVALNNSEGELIGKIDLRTGNGRPIKKGEALLEHQNVLAFPVFRPEIEFAKIALKPRGAGLFQITPTDEKGVPAVNLLSGRYLLKNLTGTFNEFSIRAGELSGTLTLQGSDAIVAIEVTRQIPIGSDPLSFDAIRNGETILTITGVSGRSMWEEDSDVVQLDEKISRVNSTRQKPVTHTVDFLPSWIDDESSSTFTKADRIATRALVKDEQNIVEAFRQLVAKKDESIETRMRQIAQLCLLYLGDAGELPKILDNPDRAYLQIPLWREAMRLGKLSINRSPVTADQFKQRIESSDSDGAKLFAMLRGFSDAQLAAGADAQLVEALKHERQAIRVAAHQTLYGITGQTLRFRPDVDLSIRNRNISNWEDALKNGAIRHRVVE